MQIWSRPLPCSSRKVCVCTFSLGERTWSRCWNSFLQLPFIKINHRFKTILVSWQDTHSVLRNECRKDQKYLPLVIRFILWLTWKQWHLCVTDVIIKKKQLRWMHNKQILLSKVSLLILPVKCFWQEAISTGAVILGFQQLHGQRSVVQLVLPCYTPEVPFLETNHQDYLLLGAVSERLSKDLHALRLTQRFGGLTLSGHQMTTKLLYVLVLARTEEEYAMEKLVSYNKDRMITHRLLSWANQTWLQGN